MNQTIFGTDGIRNTVGVSPLTYQELISLGSALAQWAHKKYGPSPRFLVGHDTRQSCSLVKAALQVGLVLHNATLYDAAALPTPAISYLLTHNADLDCGIIISASHNPYHDNGLKIIDRTSGKITAKDEQTITELFWKQSSQANEYTQLGREHSFLHAQQQYINGVSSLFKPGVLENKKIVIDCAHGATSSVAPQIFEQLGADLVVINAEPDGYNINKNCGAVYPEQLQQAVLTHNADAGFAFDGDGDRVIAVNNAGEIKSGDDILCILLDHPAYQQQTTIVGTVMTNQGFEQHLHSQNKQLIRTAVGDKHILRTLQEKNLLLGGEQSGHIILNDYLHTGDGIVTALKVLETITQNNNWSMNSFTKYPQVLINVPVTKKQNLATDPYASLIRASEEQLDKGRILVRYSGTQNLLRVMVEEQSSLHATTIAHQLAEQLHTALSV